MFLSDLPLPSISLVLHSNMLYISTQASVVNRDQDTFPILQIEPGHGVDQRDLETLEYQHFPYVLRGRLSSSDVAKQKKRRWFVRWSKNGSTSDNVPFFCGLLRKIVSTHAGRRFSKHAHS